MQEERGHKRVELRNRTEKLWMSLMVLEDLNVTTVVHHLKTHQESKHEGVIYECDKFDYKRRKWDILEFTRKVNVIV